MIDQPPTFIDLLDSESLGGESIELSIEQIDRAAQLSQSVFPDTQQWHTYIHALALFGFEQWLDEWAPDLHRGDSGCSIFQPQYASLIESVCHLDVEGFHLCLIATTGLTDDTLNLPKAVVDLPQFVPHRYVLIDVQEEQMQVYLLGYLRRDQLMQYRQLSPFATDSSWTYAIPLHWFNTDPTALLLELRCLKPESLHPYPVSSPSAPPPLDALQTRLSSLLPQLRSSHRPLSQLLTWEEASVLLRNPELVNWLYQEAEGKRQKAEGRITTPPTPHSPLPTPLNIAHWLTDRLDPLADHLRWILIPPLAPISALRSAQDELARIGIQIPPEARGAYQDLQLGNAALRLHAFTWMLSSTVETLEWTLLLILGGQPNVRLPVGTRLLIQDQTQVLFQQVLQEEGTESYLYAQVGGSLTDRFWVTIDLPDEATIALPPFIFNPDLERE